MSKKKLKAISIRVDLPEGSRGEWRIERFEVDEAAANLHNLRARISLSDNGLFIYPGTYTRLMRDGTLVMSDTPAEIESNLDFIEQAEGDVLINGLGLGWCIEALFQKDEVRTITVIEKSEDVIKLVGQHYLNKCPGDKELIIICDDAFTYKPKKNKRFDAVWHDIWDNYSPDNLPEMKRLHYKYGRKTDWQGSWGRKRCERREKWERGNEEKDFIIDVSEVYDKSR